MLTSTQTEPYTILAEVYDEVMANVNYELWADFISEVIQRHHPRPNEILELACGTGSFTFELEKFGYDITASDKSNEMIEKAQKEAKFLSSTSQFIQLNF